MESEVGLDTHENLDQDFDNLELTSPLLQNSCLKNNVRRIFQVLLSIIIDLDNPSIRKISFPIVQLRHYINGKK